MGLLGGQVESLVVRVLSEYTMTLVHCLGVENISLEDKVGVPYDTINLMDINKTECVVATVGPEVMIRLGGSEFKLHWQLGYHNGEVKVILTNVLEGSVIASCVVVLNDANLVESFRQALKDFVFDIFVF